MFVDVRVGRDVRRENQASRLPEWMPRGHGLGIDDIEASTGDCPLLQRLQQLRDAGRIHVEAAQITGIETAGDQLTALQVVDADGSSRALALDLLVAVLGISPRLGPIADWGLAMDRKQLVVDTEAFRTSVPGIYAVGDINTYPGKRKLILCGFHEATLAAFGAAEALKGDKVALQYTTTSPRLHQLLGVAQVSAPSVSA